MPVLSFGQLSFQYKLVKGEQAAKQLNPTIGKKLRSFRPTKEYKRTKVNKSRKDAIFDLELDFGYEPEPVPENEKSIWNTIERNCGES